MSTQTESPEAKAAREKQEAEAKAKEREEADRLAKEAQNSGMKFIKVCVTDKVIANAGEGATYYDAEQAQYKGCSPNITGKTPVKVAKTELVMQLIGWKELEEVG